MKRPLSLFTAVLVGGMASNLCSPARANAQPAAPSECEIAENPAGTYPTAVVVIVDDNADVTEYRIGFDREGVDFSADFWETKKPTAAAKATFKVSRSYGEVKIVGFKADGSVGCELAGEYVIATASAPVPRPAAAKAKGDAKAAPAFGLGTMQGDEVGEILPVLPITRCKPSTVKWNEGGTWTCDKELVPYNVVGQDEALGQAIIEAFKPGWFHDVGAGVGLGTGGGVVACGIASLASGGLALTPCVIGLAIGGGVGGATGTIVQLSR